MLSTVARRKLPIITDDESSSSEQSKQHQQGGKNRSKPTNERRSGVATTAAAAATAGRIKLDKNSVSRKRGDEKEPEEGRGKEVRDLTKRDPLKMLEAEEKINQGTRVARPMARRGRPLNRSNTARENRVTKRPVMTENEKSGVSCLGGSRAPAALESNSRTIEELDESGALSFKSCESESPEGLSKELMIHKDWMVRRRKSSVHRGSVFINAEELTQLIQSHGDDEDDGVISSWTDNHGGRTPQGRDRLGESTGLGTTADRDVSDSSSGSSPLRPSTVRGRQTRLETPVWGVDENLPTPPSGHNSILRRSRTPPKRKVDRQGEETFQTTVTPKPGQQSDPYCWATPRGPAGSRRPFEKANVGVSTTARRPNEGRSGNSRKVEHDVTRHTAARKDCPSKQSTMGIRKWKAIRNELISKWYKSYNTNVFGGALPENLVIDWNPRLLKTAGQTIVKRSRKLQGDNYDQLQAFTKAVDTYLEGFGDKTSVMCKVELSTKVVTNELRLCCTLLHECCHVAQFMLDGEFDAPHGPMFKKWASIATRRYPMFEVKTTHKYHLEMNHHYKCLKCGQLYRRYSKSVNLLTRRCGVPNCAGQLEYLGKIKDKSSDSQGTSQTPPRTPSPYISAENSSEPIINQTPRSLSEYQTFVKTQVPLLRRQNPEAHVSVIMSEVARLWNRRKLEQLKRETEEEGSLSMEGIRMKLKDVAAGGISPR